MIEHFPKKLYLEKVFHMKLKKYDIKFYSHHYSFVPLLLGDMKMKVVQN